MNDKRTEQDGLDVSDHNIPDKYWLASKPFDVLAAFLAESRKDSARHTVIDREIKKRLAKDSAGINRNNVIIGACAGGVFGLLGVILGNYLKSENQISPAGTVQQVNHGYLAEQPQVANMPSVKSIASQPVAVPSHIKPDAQASQNRP